MHFVFMSNFNDNALHTNEIPNDKFNSYNNEHMKNISIKQTVTYKTVRCQIVRIYDYHQHSWTI